MCGGTAEWKDSRGIPRYSEQSRDFFNRKYARADAATAKLAAFDTAAAETQTPEYHSGRETAFKDEYGDDFQKEYDAALNAISEGFIRRGIYNQKDYDTQKGALDKNPLGQARLDQMAKAYADKAKSDVSTERSQLFETVNALKDLEGRRAEIEGTTWDLDTAPAFGHWQDGVWKEENPGFLGGVEKLFLNQAPVAQQRSARVSGSPAASAPSPSRSARQRTLTNSMGVRTPYSQKSQKVVG